VSAPAPEADARQEASARGGPPGQLGHPDERRGRPRRPSRSTLALGLLLLATLALLAVLAPRGSGALDPASAEAEGSRAVAEVLRGLGVEVLDVRSTAEVEALAGGATVLVTEPALATPDMVDRVLARRPARLVLLGPLPGDPWFDRLAADVRPVAPEDERTTEPGCAWAVARRAGPAQVPGLRYDGGAWPAGACYSGPESSGVLVLPGGASRPEVVLLGSPVPLTNAGLDEQGNAALALGMLGAHPRLGWWRPSPADPALAAGGPSALGDLVPRWVLPALAQVLLGCAVLAWWRGRRLGHVVVEPLPVVVPSGETTAGRARLLHAQHARGEAAEHLRADTRQRLASRLGLPRWASAESLVAAVSSRTGRHPGEVTGLLYGPHPADDDGLVALGHELQGLLGEVGGA